MAVADLALDAAATLRASGGVVWRRTDDGGLEVLLVHRPGYDDWVLPQGRTLDELGLRCTRGPFLRTTVYTGSAGRPKLVRYSAFEACGAAVTARGGDVDEVRWVPLRRVPRVLSYPREVGVVDAFRSLVGA